MGGRGRIRYVFTSSYSERGFYTFIPGLLEGLKKVYILKGPAGSGKSTFIRLLGDSLSELGYEIEFWVSAVDSMKPEGVYIPRMETAIVNGNLPAAIDPKYPGVTGHIINFEEYLDAVIINEHRQEIIELVDKVEKQEDGACSLLQQASALKEELLQETAEYINSGNISKLIEKLANEILTDKPGEKHYFATSLNAEGMFNYVDEISVACKSRYIFKGPIGSGKSQVITELARKARDKGYSVEYYHGGLNPESAVMIIIANLNLALIDAGDMEISIRPWDVVVDMGEYLDKSEQRPTELHNSELTRQYEALLMKAQAELENTHRSLKNLKRLYSGAMDFKQVEAKRQEILALINS